VGGTLEVADVLRRHGAAYRAAHSGHLGLQQRRVMGAVEACRTAALGGHVWHCDDCGHSKVGYNSCRNRHCPKCQGAARAQWVAARRADLLPVPYFHVVFTLPAPAAAIAYHNKRLVYAILFRAASETLRIIAADPRHLGARIGGVAVLHSWGQAMQHHPHVHCIVPGGGLALDGSRWISCPEGFFLSVRVLGRLFRRLFLEQLGRAHAAGKLRFSGTLADLADPATFKAHCAALRRIDWVVYAKRPFGSPEQVLAYLGRYTHRVAIANSRLIDMTGDKVWFRWKDYRKQGVNKVMVLTAAEFIRRFLLHVLPSGFHRIRHFGFMANGHRTAKLARCRALLAGDHDGPNHGNPRADRHRADRHRAADTFVKGWSPPCPCCGGAMIRALPIPRSPQRRTGREARAP
jgi:hypothetical protein